MEIVNVKGVGSTSGKIDTVIMTEADGTPIAVPTFALLKFAESGIAFRSVKTYAKIIRLFLTSLEHTQQHWKTLTDRQMSGFLYLLFTKQLPHQTKKNQSDFCKDSYMKLVIAALSSYYKELAKYGICEVKDFSFKYTDDTPQDVIINSDVFRRNYINESTYEKLLANVGGKTTFIMRRNEIALMLGYECGVRSHELARANNFSVNRLKRLIDKATNELVMSTQQLKIIGKGKKGGKARIIFIKPSLMMKIDLFINNYKEIVSREDSIFCELSGKKLTDDAYGTKTFAAAASATFDDELNDKHYHSLRHTFATNLVTYCYEHGHDPRLLVPERMGHVSWDITFGYIDAEAVLNNRPEVKSAISLEKSKRDKAKWAIKCG